MLDKIKNFVKSVSVTTWILVGVGVLALAFLWHTTGKTPVVRVETVPPAAAK